MKEKRLLWKLYQCESGSKKDISDEDLSKVDFGLALNRVCINYQKNKKVIEDLLTELKEYDVTVDKYFADWLLLVPREIENIIPIVKDLKKEFIGISILCKVNFESEYPAGVIACDITDDQYKKFFKYNSSVNTHMLAIWEEY